MNSRQKSMVIGGILGAVVGVLGGYLFTRSLPEPTEEQAPQKLSLRSIPPGEMVKLAIGIMGVLRSVAELGERL
jgi:hypothetical protein